MKLRLRLANSTAVKCNLLVLGLAKSYMRDPVFQSLDKASQGRLQRLAKAEDFQGRAGQQVLMAGASGLEADRVLLIGLAKAHPSQAARWRSLAAQASRWARKKGIKRLAFCVPGGKLDDEDWQRLAWLAEGCLGGAYAFDRLKQDEKRRTFSPSVCELVIDPLSACAPARISALMRRQVELGRLRAEAIDWVRDLVNEPPNLLGPRELEQQAREMAESRGMGIKVLGDKAIAGRGMGLLASVAAGTRHGGRLLHLHHRPESPHRGCLALVGKGVTFDSGGLSLKPPASQPDMKSDMAGAATVLGVLRAAADEQLPWEIHAIVPICENMPGPGATRPGDVFRGMCGKTVEVRNTDAEGRLILADALSYAVALKPDLIVDFATLTGACMVALGPLTAGVFGNRAVWRELAREAADSAGELVWPLPLEPGLRSELRSDVADLRNAGSRWGGAITAALFLSEFVEDCPWLHFDIAGPAFLDKAGGFHPKGGTGFGVLTMLELLRRATSLDGLA